MLTIAMRIMARDSERAGQEKEMGRERARAGEACYSEVQGGGGYGLLEMVRIGGCTNYGGEEGFESRVREKRGRGRGRGREERKSFFNQDTKSSCCNSSCGYFNY